MRGPVGADISASFDLIINGTSAGLSSDVPVIPESAIGPDTRVYDMVYGSGNTAFMLWAQQRGVTQASDGLGMLVEQAAAAFRIWFASLPVEQLAKINSEAVIRSVRAQLESGI